MGRPGHLTFEKDNSETVSEDAYYNNGGNTNKDVTGIAAKYNASGHRLHGDPAQDYVASLEDSIGAARKTSYRVTDPTGKVIEADCTLTDIVMNGPNGEANSKTEISFAINRDGDPRVVKEPSGNQLPESVSVTNAGEGKITVAAQSTQALQVSVLPRRRPPAACRGGEHRRGERRRQRRGEGPEGRHHPPGRQVRRQAVRLRHDRGGGHRRDLGQGRHPGEHGRHGRGYALQPRPCSLPGSAMGKGSATMKTLKALKSFERFEVEVGDETVTCTIDCTDTNINRIAAKAIAARDKVLALDSLKQKTTDLAKLDELSRRSPRPSSP